MKRVVVVGAGFGGIQAITDLDRILRGDRDVEILLVSDQNYLLFTPLLPQIASSYTDPRHIVQAVREIRGNVGSDFAVTLSAPWMRRTGA